jgi:hypothetical protein
MDTLSKEMSSTFLSPDIYKVVDTCWLGNPIKFVAIFSHSFWTSYEFLLYPILTNIQVLPLCPGENQRLVEDEPVEFEK